MKKRKPIIGLNMDCSIRKDRLWHEIPENYVNAIVEAGGIPSLFPIFRDKKLITEQIKQCDGFLFMGGDDYPAKYFGMKSDSNEDPMLEQRADYDIKIAKMILNTKIPILGICGGCQLINIVKGGKMILNIEGHGKGKDVYHSVNIVKDGILKNLFKKDKLRINSGHHQAIDPNFISDELKITAMTDDGVVEAIEGIEERFILGLQWHPERSDDSVQRKTIFKRFINECKMDH